MIVCVCVCGILSVCGMMCVCMCFEGVIGSCMNVRVSVKRERKVEIGDRVAVPTCQLFFIRSCVILQANVSKCLYELYKCSNHYLEYH